MLSIGLVGAGGAGADYYLARQAGCAAGYYVVAGEPRGLWMGSGAAALGLAGALSEPGGATFRALLGGVGPDGTRLVGPVLRADPRSRVAAAPLVAAIRDAAAEAGSSPAQLLGPRAAAVFERAARGLTRSKRGAAGLRADMAVGLGEAAGIDAHAIYRAAALVDGDEPACGPPQRSHPVVDRRVGPLAEALAGLGKKADARRAGLDLTFSAPKSVSFLHAFGPPEIAAAVEAAHSGAIAEALAYMESVAGRALRGHHGDGLRAERIATNGFVAVAFEHYCSRALDPQLHTHVVVANLLRGVDGRWSALDTRAIHRHARTAGYVYQAVLRSRLTETLGVDWTSVRRGQAEVVGVRRRALKLFSTRRAQIEKDLALNGVDGPRAARLACLATRPAKSVEAHDVEALVRRWWRKAADGGVDPDEMIRRVLAAATAPRVLDAAVSAVVAELLGPDGLTRDRTAFDAGEILRSLCERLPAAAGLDLAALRQLTTRVLADPRLVELSVDDEHASSRRWTTGELLATETDALALADRLRAVPDRPVPIDEVEAALSGTKLSTEQAAMVRALTAGTGRLHVVVGPAGSGKTAALALARRVWRAAGRDVYGASLSALAAANMQSAAGIDACSLARLLGGLDSGRGAQRLTGAVLVVDEAGMVSTRNLHRLLRHAHARDMTLVLVGDPAQLPEIGAGGLFARLVDDGAVRLAENRRQAQPWERAALASLRDGDVPAALDAYHGHGRVAIAPDHQQLQRSIAVDYLSYRQQHPAPGAVLVLAASRRHAAHLNDAIRAELAAARVITGPPLVCGAGDEAFELRRGDLALVTVNDHDRGLLNGERAIVQSVDQGRGRLAMRTVDGRTHTVATGWAAEHLAHGYAMTCHKAQGQTTEITLVAGSAALTLETAYTALSRGRSANYLYLAPEAEPSLGQNRAQAWIVDHALAEAAGRAARSGRQRLATEQLPAARRRTPMRPEPGAARGMSRAVGE